jgi:hypothetical protein
MSFRGRRAPRLSLTTTETKPVMVNPGNTKTCFITAFLQIANPYLSLFVRLQHQPFPNIVQIIQLKMRSMSPPAASSSLPLPICYRSPPVIPCIGDCFPCGSINLGKYVLYSSALRQRARWHTSLALLFDGHGTLPFADNSVNADARRETGCSSARGSRRTGERGRNGWCQ